MPTKQITRATLAEHVMLNLQCLDEQESIEGNASSIDPETDAKCFEWIRSQLARGNDWAWCCVQLTATYEDAIHGELTASDSLGCCSYESEADFRRPGGYYSDMVNSVLDDLWAQLQARTPAGRAKALAQVQRQAITTKDRDRGGLLPRVIARCQANRITVDWQDALSPSENHAAAALQLMDQLGWSERNTLVMGGTRDGYVFVQVPKR